MAPLLLLALSEGPASGHGGIWDVPIGHSVWTIVIFLVLLLVLRKFAWKPIATALDSREKSIRESLEKAEQARAEVNASLQKQKEILDQARAQAVAMAEQARAAAEKAREETVAQARNEAKATMERGLRELKLQQEAAAAELRRQTVDLALAAAEKVVRRTLSDADHRRLAEEAVKEAGSRL
jgi:F-type H+-transporting ATPase subunit b